MDHWVVMLLFCSSRIVHPYRRNQPWFQVCPRTVGPDAKIENVRKFISRGGGGSHIWNGYGCKARTSTGWGIRWEHRLKKWGVIGWEHDFWHPVREKSKNMRSYWSKNEGHLVRARFFSFGEWNLAFGERKI